MRGGSWAITVWRALIRSAPRTSPRSSASHVTGARWGPGEKNCTEAGNPHKHCPLSFPLFWTMGHLLGESLHWLIQSEHESYKILKPKVLLRDWMSQCDDTVPSISVGIGVQGDLAHGAWRGDSGANFWQRPTRITGNISLGHKKDWSSLPRNYPW